MAVVNTKSTIVSNADATPAALTSSYLHRATIKESVAEVEVDVSDDNNSVYRLFRVNSNDRISSLRIKSDAIADATDYNVGFYDPADRGGAIVGTGNQIDDAVDISAGFALPTYLGTDLDAANMDVRVWELLGLSEDPHQDYDLCLTGVAVGTASGTIACILQTVE